MQIDKISKEIRFLPVFYETSVKKEMLTLKDLKNYYIFRCRPDFHVKHKTAQELKRMLS